MPAQARNLPAKLTVDFTGVEIGGGGGGDYVPAGDYLGRVIDANVKPNKDDPANKHIQWTIEIYEPSKYKGKKVKTNTSLKQGALWKLRGMLADILGGPEKVPAKSLDLPLAKIVAAKPWIGFSTEDDEYKGKLKADITGTFSRADWAALSGNAETDTDEDEAEEAEEETPKAAKTKKAEPEKEEEEEGEEMEELELDDL